MEQLKVKGTTRRMTEARAVLVRDHPFFGHLSMRLRLACAPCGTACTDGDRLIFDPDFAEKLSDGELQFVILHEVLHCVLAHCDRGKNRNSLLYNIACDIVVNSVILDMWGIDTFSIAGEKVIHQAPDGTEGRFYNAEEIYYMLLQKKGHTLRSGDNGMKDAGVNDAGIGGEAASGIESGIPSFDRHDLWQGICDKAQLRDNWSDRIRIAIKECGDLAGMPQSIRRVVWKLAERAGLDWKQLLHDFLQFDQYDYTFVPPDRRYAGTDFYLPAFNADDADGNGNADNIWVCVDTSASISRKELACAMAEILDAMRQVQMNGKISFFDSNITEPEPFEAETEIKKITPSGGGGTSFQIIFDYLKERMYPELPKAILIFTDGYARWPVEQNSMDVPVLWLISEDGKDDVPWGRVVKLRKQES